MLMESERVD